MGLRQAIGKKPFESVVHEQGATVLRVCRAVLGVHDADDAWSDTFLAALQAYPDLPHDANVQAWLVTIAHRKCIDHLRAGNYRAWRDTPLAQMEAAGQQEVLNWTCLAGAMAELDYKADILDWVETWAFNAPKCLAVFRPA